MKGFVVFFMYGVVENGKIFYIYSNKGLVLFLVEYGYVCYVVDLCGCGESKFVILKYVKYG